MLKLLLKEVVTVAGTFNDSIKQSTEDFQKLCLPIYLTIYKNTEFISLENTDNHVATLLDTFAGIDALLVHHHNKTIEGVANRVQRACKNWATFTIRYSRDNGSPTEYQKRIAAFKSSGLFPAWTIQAYISQDGKNVLGLAVAPTAELWKYIENEKPEVKHTGSDQYGQASFFVIPWRDMRKKKYRIMTVTPTENSYLVDWGNGKKFVIGRH